MSNILVAKNLSKSYNQVSVLKNIDLEIKNNQITTIIGPSGAGKTTLIQILGTLDKPNKKEKSTLQIDKVDIFSLNNNELSKFRNQKIGFIFQFHELLPEFSALENVCMPKWIAGENLKNSKVTGVELLNSLGLKNRINHKPSQLSGGEQQKVAVARALINNPKIIFADEPTGNLDSENAELLHQLFFSLRDKMGCSFVIVTHNELLTKRSDQIISLKDGKIIR